MFRRTGVTALVVAVGCVANLAGQTAVAQSKSGEKRTRASAIALLNKRVEKIDWVDTPFEEVIAWIKAEGDERINVIPRWNVLSDESVDRDTLVNLQLIDSTVAEILNEAIEQLSDSSEIGYRAHSNRITISTKTDFGRKLELVVYDASDVLFRVEDMGQEAPQIDLQQTTSGGGGGGGGGQSVFQGGGSSGGGSSRGGEQATRLLEARLLELRTLIEEIIAPTTWDTASPPGRGRIRVFNNSLFVFNTIEVHEQISGSFSIGR